MKLKRFATYGIEAVAQRLGFQSASLPAAIGFQSARDLL
jgi:hypothetical protein